MTMTGVDSHDADNRAYRVLFCLCPNLITVVDGKDVGSSRPRKSLGVAVFFSSTGCKKNVEIFLDVIVTDSES